MKKKIFVSLGIVGLATAIFALGVFAASDIKLFINGKQVKADIQIINGSSYVPLKVVSESLGANVVWDGVSRTITITSIATATPTPIPVATVAPTPAPTPSPAPTPLAATSDSAAGLRKYLESNYSTLKTSIGDTKLNFSIIENNKTLSPYDYWIMVGFDLSFYNDLQYGNKITDAQRSVVKAELKSFIETMGKDIMVIAPTKKIYSNYYYSWYKYPSIKEGFTSIKFDTWQNYTDPSYTSTNVYEDAKVSIFRWNDFTDDK